MRLPARAGLAVWALGLALVPTGARGGGRPSSVDLAVEGAPLGPALRRNTAEGAPQLDAAPPLIGCG